MNTDEIEGGLRDALASRAAEVPAQAGDRLRQHNYRPRTRGRRLPAVVGTGLALVALAAGGGAYLASGSPEANTHPARPPEAASAPPNAASIQLAGYTFTLPAGFKPTNKNCGTPPGAPTSFDSRFAAGASADGGCFLVSVVLLQQATDATPVQIGPYQGYVSSYPAKRLVILTIGQAPDRHISIVARGPTESQVIARDALSKPDASN